MKIIDQAEKFNESKRDDLNTFLDGRAYRNERFLASQNTADLIWDQCCHYGSTISEPKLKMLDILKLDQATWQKQFRIL